MVGASQDTLRVVFFGTPAFAVPTLEALVRSRHAVVAVVTQPDRPRGRGHKTTAAPVKSAALAAGLPILQPDRLKTDEFMDSFRALGADLSVVAAYGKILPETLIQTPRLGMINVHASLLPRYRGAAPVHRAIIAGERETGITIMRVVKALDAGPMMATVTRPIDPDETSDVVEQDLARLGAPLLLSVVEQLAAGAAEERPQDDGAATYASRLVKDDGVVDWLEPARRVHDRIRGLHPWPHAFSFLDGERVILLQSRVADAATSAAPGAVIETGSGRLSVATGDGVVDIVRLQLEGKRPMDARDFLAGHPVRAGSRFRPAP